MQIEVDTHASRRREAVEDGRPATVATDVARRCESVVVRCVRESINGADEERGGSGWGRNTGAPDCVTSRKVSAAVDPTDFARVCRRLEFPRFARPTQLTMLDWAG